MDRYAVIGKPISHSLSPCIHGAFAFETAQVLRYDAIEIGAENLSSELSGLHAKNVLGLNVTLPHKQNVAKLCESISPRAELAGAVNTLIRTTEGWRGDNTDGIGLITDLRQLGISVRGKRVLIVGAGGAVRGILKPLLDEQPAVLAISNRNPWKPEALAELFKAHGTVLPRTHFALKGEQYDLIINATSAGHDGVMPFIPGQVLAADGVCYDLSYGPAHAPFAAWARAQGASRVVDGLGMLIEQAATAFEIWRGVRPQTAPVLASLRGNVGDTADTEPTVPTSLRRAHVEKPPQD